MTTCQIDLAPYPLVKFFKRVSTVKCPAHWEEARFTRPLIRVSFPFDRVKEIQVNDPHAFSILNVLFTGYCMIAEMYKDPAPHGYACQKMHRLMFTHLDIVDNTIDILIGVVPK